jgi:hypothetical protein
MDEIGYGNEMARVRFGKPFHHPALIVILAVKAKTIVGHAQQSVRAQVLEDIFRLAFIDIQARRRRPGRPRFTGIPA